MFPPCNASASGQPISQSTSRVIINNTSAQQEPLTLSGAGKDVEKSIEKLEKLLQPYSWKREENFSANIFAAIQAGHFPTNQEINLVGFTFYHHGHTIKLPANVTLNNCVVGSDTTLRYYKGDAVGISRGAVLVAMGTAIAKAGAAKSSAYGMGKYSQIEGHHQEAILIKFNRDVSSTVTNGCQPATECYSANALKKILGSKFTEDLQTEIVNRWKHGQTIVVPIPKRQHSWVESMVMVTTVNSAKPETDNPKPSSWNKVKPQGKFSGSAVDDLAASPWMGQRTNQITSNQLPNSTLTNVSPTSIPTQTNGGVDAALQTLEDDLAYAELDTLFESIDDTPAQAKTSGDVTSGGANSNGAPLSEELLDKIIGLLVETNDTVVDNTVTTTATATVTTATTSTQALTTTTATTRGRRDFRLNREDTQKVTDSIRKARFAELIGKAPTEINKDDRDFLFNQISANKNSYTSEQINDAQKLMRLFDLLNAKPKDGMSYFIKQYLDANLAQAKNELEILNKQAEKKSGDGILAKFRSDNQAEKTACIQKIAELKPKLMRMMVFQHTFTIISDPTKLGAIYQSAINNHKQWSEQVAPTNGVTKSSSCVVEVIAGDWGDVTRDMSIKHGGQIYVVLNMANAHFPGGGTGLGAAAQEENVFRRTDCSQTGKQEEVVKNGDAYVISTHHAGMRYTEEATVLINGEQGKVYLDMGHPRVCFKASEADKYKELAPDQCFLFYEMRSAAIDLRQSDNQKLSPKELEGKVRKGVAAQLDTLVEAGQRRVVLGAWGCGAFRHSPDNVSRIFKEEIAARVDQFDHIVFAIFTGTSNSASSTQDQAYNQQSMQNLVAFQKTFSAQ